MLKEIKTEHSVETRIMKQKFSYFGDTKRANASMENVMTLGKADRIRRGKQPIRWINGLLEITEMHLQVLHDVARGKMA